MFQNFARLPNLRTIDLSKNSLHRLENLDFSHARGLTKLILAHNNIEVTSNITNSIVQAPSLKTLDLTNCGIGYLPNNSFKNLSSLVILNLEKNPTDDVRIYLSQNIL